MNSMMKKNQTSKSIFDRFWKLALIVLTMFALILAPYKIDFQKGTIDHAVLLADDDGGDGDDDDDDDEDDNEDENEENE